MKHNNESLSWDNVKYVLGNRLAEARTRRRMLRDPDNWQKVRDSTGQDFFAHLNDLDPNPYRSTKHYTGGVMFYLSVLGLDHRALRDDVFNDLTMLMTDKQVLMNLMSTEDIIALIDEETPENVCSRVKQAIVATGKAAWT